MEATTIESLNLISTPDLTGIGGTVTERWYGFLGAVAGLVAWGTKPVSPRYGTAVYVCDVTLPALTVGSQEDRASDVSAALGRHLDRLGLTV